MYIDYGYPERDPPHPYTPPLKMQDSMITYSGRRLGRQTATSDIQYTNVLHL